ncbi:MAG TPA: ATP-binding protein [Armatimonadetes bacterium]|nr:ATP-binding protein [Armatimonadota bacterium]
MKPWWQVATPHRDIREGRFDEAVFAADLGDVLYERGPMDYRDPETFFRRTYLTAGLRQLVQTVGSRLMGKAGEGVIQLQTPFGGGKTHALLVLYHLFRHYDRVAHLESVQDLLHSETKAMSSVRVAAFVGTHADVEAGRTPWGELAAQLGDYERVKLHDEKRLAPGKEVLRGLLERNAPALLLVDELLEYVVKAAGVRVEEGTLKGQVLAFLQELTETVAALPQVALVLTLPSSLLERYDEAAEEALAQLQRISGRVEAIYTPVEGVEIYEIVRKRLFDDLGEPSDHRLVADGYFQLYQSLGENVPVEAREIAYRERMVRAYPFHPELIDILFERWGTFASFQRTRGVLRLLAQVVGDLYRREHPAPLIQPAHLNLRDTSIRREFVKHIGNVYESVIAADIADHHAKARRLDEEMGAEYRPLHVASSLATAIFFYSHSSGRLQGLGLPRLRLAFLRPGISSAIVGDALGRLENELWYLHKEENRYYFHSQPNLNRVLLDKQEAVVEEEVEEEIRRQVEEAAGKDFPVYPRPETSRDIPNNQTLKLVLLSQRHTRDAPGTETLLRELYERHGESPRTYRNTLLFLLPEDDNLQTLKQTIRRWLALQAVKADRALLETLSEADRRDLDRRLREAESSLSFQVLSAYRVLAKSTSQGLQFYDLGMPTVGEKTLSGRVKAFLENEEMLLRQISPRYVQERLLGGREEMGYRTMADAFFTSPDYPFLESEEVLKTAIANGVRQKSFGLRAGGQIYFGEGLATGLIDDEACIINQDLAARFKEEQERREREREKQAEYEEPEGEEETGVREGETPLPEGHFVRIIAHIPWDKLSDFMSGVLTPLQSAGAEVGLKVELTAQAQEPISPGVLDFKVRETLQQIGAKVEKFETS